MKIHLKYVVITAMSVLTGYACLGKMADIQKGDAAGKTKRVKHNFTVAHDGTGDFRTVQEAIDAAPGDLRRTFVISVKPGVYKEIVTIPVDKSCILLKGEESGKTIITFDNYAKRLNREGKEFGTSGSATVFIKGDNFLAENITFENTAGISAGQALAINISAAKSAFRNCRFLAHQDTYFAANGTVQYLKDCFIAGTVDFIFGGSVAFFENCELHSLRGGYLTAASTPAEQKFGYVFSNCKITATSGLADASVYLGRPWRPHASVVFLNCEMGAHIRPEGWHNWGNPNNETTARYLEYNSTGPGYQQGKRHAWSVQLNKEEAKAYSKKQVLGSWKPFK